VLWAKERLGIDLWSLQRDIAESVRDNKKTIVKSCHDSGKTFLAAILICWWIDVHPPEQTVVVTTAPTDAQVKKLMWEYVRKLHRNHNLSGVVSEAAEWKSEDRDIVGFGRKPADTNIHGFQGIHRMFVLVIIDEACGVPQQLWTGVEAITTNAPNRVLAIGNPDEPNTEFGRIFIQKDPSWTPFTISAFDTPNFTDEYKEMDPDVRLTLLDPAWVEEKKISWGENSGRYRAKVLAEFPISSDENLFPISLLQDCVDRTLLPPSDARPVLGVDVARFGNDKSTVVMNMGGVIEVLDSWEKADTVETAHRVHEIALRVGAEQVRVDDTGVGAGVTDQLIRLGAGMYHVIRMVGSAASPDIRKWYNARAFWHDDLREQMTRGEISLPEFSVAASDSKTLFEELEGLRYGFLRGAILIESKDQMRARGMKSPDFSDAAVYASAKLDVDDPMLRLAPGDIIIDDPWAEWDAQGYVISPY